MSATFTGPSHVTAQREKVRLTERDSKDRSAVILGIAVGVMVWGTIAAMAVFAFGRL